MKRSTKIFFKNLSSESEILDLTKTDSDGKLLHGFGAYGSIGLSGDDGEDGMLEAIKELLPDNEAFIYKEIGNENLRYLVGIAAIVTKKGIHVFDLDKLVYNYGGKLNIINSAEAEY